MIPSSSLIAVRRVVVGICGREMTLSGPTNVTVRSQGSWTTDQRSQDTRPSAGEKHLPQRLSRGRYRNSAYR